jgi:hypothetical protein
MWDLFFMMNWMAVYAKYRGLSPYRVGMAELFVVLAMERNGTG